MPQLKLNVAGKPSIPKWIPAPATKENLEWASLRTLDLALLDGSLEDQAALVETCRAAIQEDGFLYLQNFGVSEEVVGDFTTRAETEFRCNVPLTSPNTAASVAA